MEFMHFALRLSARMMLGPLFFLFAKPLFAQELQLHYDPRHTLDPANNPRNYPTVYFQYYRSFADSGSSFVKPGSFLFKMQADLAGDKDNMAKSYLQLTQSFRCWKPKIFLSLQYSGGLGVTEPKQYSYYIVNTFCAGVDFPFRWKDARLSSVLDYKYIPYTRPSHDFLYTLYWWKGYCHYKLEFSGDFSIWTENSDHGDGTTPSGNGKRFFFFAEPQLWLNLTKGLALGTKVNSYYHVYTIENVLQVYPTIALKYKL